MRKKLQILLSQSIAIAHAHLKIAHENRFLGVLWFVISPLFTFFLLYFVFLTVFSSSLSTHIKLYPLYLLIGIVMYNFFRQVTGESARVLYDHRHMIKSIAFPYASLVLSALWKALLLHGIEIAILASFFIYYGIPVWHIALYFVVLFFGAIFILGISLILASISVFFMDLENLWSFFMHILWFATPIFYLPEQVPQLKPLNFINPFYYYITAGRDISIYFIMPPLHIIGGILIFPILSLAFGILVFNVLGAKFADHF